MDKAHNKCKQVIEKYHMLIEEVFRLFHKSEKLTDVYAVDEIKKAIKILKKTLEINLEGVEIIEEAENLLEKSGCTGKCNKESEACKKIYRDAVGNFEHEEAKLVKAMEKLEEALCLLEESVSYRKKAYVKVKEYLKCVHRKKPSPEPIPPCDKCNKCN